MGFIKNNISDITDLRLGEVDINYVYIGVDLLWQRVVPVPANYNIINFDTTVTFNMLNSDQSKYTTTVTLKI